MARAVGDIARQFDVVGRNALPATGEAATGLSHAKFKLDQGLVDTPEAVAVGAAANQFAMAVRESTAIRDALAEALALFRQGQQRAHYTTVVDIPGAGLTIDPATGIINPPALGGILEPVTAGVQRVVFQDEINKACDLVREADENAARVIGRDVKREPPGYDWPQVATLKEAEAAKSEERFPAAERYIFGEMQRNIHTPNADKAREILASGDLTEIGVVLAAWYENVKSGGPWDHKPKIENEVGLDSSVDFYFKVPSDARGREVYYDIWSNIHYGYVGRAWGFTRGWLQFGAAAAPGAGTNDEADVASVDVGVQLWNRFGEALPFDELHAGVLGLVDTFQRLQDQGTKVTQLRVWHYSPEVLARTIK
ncbi:polymorphic toxin type 44 domain-containing protein [Streptomyces coacervatus]|uniref:polymorphic toxin type 44 domain-containing protein n=1 Tax=Streptomyces coacervatus TaxID=647381 RepID=UPI0023DBF095|nr:polymorphic toxin type 44 domain-containing protein [Streptomyces coacervatus]MDF2265242.1 polymorphic toxin type 44 domain-containing protein [Streptomyces coacervatus]